LSSLASEIAKITTAPLDIVYDCISYPETQIAGHELLVPGGTLVVLLRPVPEVQTADKQVARVFGSFTPASARAQGREVHRRLPGLLEDGTIKASRFVFGRLPSLTFVLILA
jgi:hypothetical protein